MRIEWSEHQDPTKWVLHNMKVGWQIKTPSGVGKCIALNPHGVLVVMWEEVRVFKPEEIGRYKQNLTQAKEAL